MIQTQKQTQDFLKHTTSPLSLGEVGFGKSLGTSLTEYLLIGALVGVGSIGGLTLLANTFDTGMPDLLSLVFGNNAAVSSTPSTSGAAPTIGSGFGPEGDTHGSEYDYPTENVCFSNDNCLSIPVLSDQAVTETTGGLGDEEIRMFANVLKDLAEELKESGADNELVALVERLANSGHGLGDVFSSFETLNVTGSKALAGDITMESEEFKGFWSEWNKKMADYAGGCAGGDEAGYCVTGSATGNFSAAYEDLNAYLATHPSAYSTFPQAKGIIDHEVGQIQGVVDGFHATSWFTSGNNAQISHQSANVICGAGAAGTGDCFQ